MPPKRALWSEENLVAAVRAVESGTLSTYAASNKYQIPRRTLSSHVKTGSLKKSLGRKSMLGDEHEAELVQRIVRFAEIGVPITPKILRRLVYKFCEDQNIKHNFSDKTKLAGKAWLKAFIKRNPIISKKEAQFMNPSMALKLHKFIVNDHFTRFREIYDDLDINNHPERIYNMDLLLQKEDKRVHLQSAEYAESVAIAGCVNAVGTAIPPMIIFKGKRPKGEPYENLPPGALVEHSSKDFMANDQFDKFLRHLAKYKSPGTCLLVFDRAACHLDLTIVDIADSLGIALYGLPSNALDKATYRSFKHHWDAEVSVQMQEKTLTEARFNVIISNVWSKSMTHVNITSGFKESGLFPLNPEKIPETAFASSMLTEVTDPLSFNLPTTSTLGSSCQCLERTPTKKILNSSAPIFNTNVQFEHFSLQDAEKLNYPLIYSTELDKQLMPYEKRENQQLVEERTPKCEIQHQLRAQDGLPWISAKKSRICCSQHKAHVPTIFSGSATAHTKHKQTRKVIDENRLNYENGAAVKTNTVGHDYIIGKTDINNLETNSNNSQEASTSLESFTVLISENATIKEETNIHTEIHIKEELVDPLEMIVPNSSSTIQVPEETTSIKYEKVQIDNSQNKDFFGKLVIKMCNYDLNVQHTIRTEIMDVFRRADQGFYANTS